MLPLTDKAKEVLLQSFIKKCKNRNSYSFFAEIAREEGLDNVARVFEKFSDHEKEHAKVLQKFLKGQGNIKVDFETEIPQSNSTLQNLRNSYGDADYCYNTWFTNCAKISNDGGFTELTSVFVSIANAEKCHSNTFKKLIEKIERNSFFRSSIRKMWLCDSCGCIFVGAIAPTTCHFCGKSQDFFYIIENQ